MAAFEIRPVEARKFEKQNDVEDTLKTCLYDRHIALGAQMSPFGGFIMPIQYSSITLEHNAVRNNVGMFDISHMGEVFAQGPDAQKFVEHIFSNKVEDMPDGKALYGMMLNPEGGIVDDLLVYKEFEPDHYLLVINAANIAKDYGWMLENSKGYNVTLKNESDTWGQIALQGPKAEETLKVLGLEAASMLTFYTYIEMKWAGERLIVSRTGYTGEDGFEFYGSHKAIGEIWDALLRAGVTPCGLGCRDTLRFEAGLPLYGHELSDEVTPLEAGLGMFVKLDKSEFIGKEPLAAQKAAGVTKKLVGIELDDKAVPRAEYPVLADGVQVGIVTTGYRSISLDKSICMAMVEKKYSDPGTRLEVQIRKKTFAGTVCKKRFYETHYKK